MIPERPLYQHPPMQQFDCERNITILTGLCTDHQANFKKVRRDAHENVDFAEKIEVQRGHSVIVRDAGEKVHEDQLTVALATVTGFLV